MAGLNSYNRDDMTCKPENIYYLALKQKFAVTVRYYFTPTRMAVTGTTTPSTGEDVDKLEWKRKTGPDWCGSVD